MSGQELMGPPAETAATGTASTLHVEERGDGILAIILDRPDSKVNLIDLRWVEDMTSSLDRIERESPRGLVMFSAKPGNFIAGADVSLIAGLDTVEEARAKAREGQQLLERIEKLPFPTVAAINGSCLGGGLETALAFRWRVAADESHVVLGLPEVRLGILPGFGGTVRLPRRIGITAALPLILTGRNLRPRQALSRGLVDRLTAPERLEPVALAVAGGERPKKRRRPLGGVLTDAFLARTPPGRAILKRMTLKNVMKETRGHYPAPLEIVDRVIAGSGMRASRAMREEAEAFGRLAVTPVAKNLLALFQGGQALARHPWTGSPASTDRASKRAAVIGAGTMGGGIAGALARAGLAVRMKDVATESLRLGLEGAARPLNRRVKRRHLTPRERDEVLARIAPTTQDTGLARVDFVIEAVPEDLDLKVRVFRQLETAVPESAFLATNTSSIPIGTIAEGIDSPERLVGIHFFNPVDRMPLVEVIPGERTRADVLNRAVGVVRRLKKSPLVVADRPGFLVNRLLLPYLNEAAHAVDDGWSVERVDEALLRFGMPMGPLRVLDEVGLDVAAKVSKVLEAAYGERATPAKVMGRLLAAGALGTKTARGFWIVSGKERTPNDRDLGVPPTGVPPSDDTIVYRVLLGMINEAARCLHEGVVADPEHLDLGTVLGAGFPPFRGGVRRWAISLGETEVRRRLDDLAKKYGARFAPAEALGDLFRFG
jgi:3-hydroxyacyl-CoA dehydrogenase/enoyl-CoA hydratase/3-hydroxybutyryl-CoA epimerase